MQVLTVTYTVLIIRGSIKRWTPFHLLSSVVVNPFHVLIINYQEKKYFTMCAQLKSFLIYCFIFFKEAKILALSELAELRTI